MNKLIGAIFGLFMIFSLATSARAVTNGLVQPGAGISIRHYSNGIAWQGAAGIGLYNTTADIYGIMTTDKVNGIDWGFNTPSASPSGAYWQGQARLDHIPLTNPSFWSQCKGGPNYPYTSDNCTFGISGLDLIYQTWYGAGGPESYQTDSSIVYMSGYPSFITGSISPLVTTPMGISGTALSTAVPTPPQGETLSYYNSVIQNIDFGTVVNTAVELLAYDGPNPGACDPYNDCWWYQPSAYSSNYGAPNTNTSFWTWPDPNGNGYGPMRNTYNFIQNNSQYLTDVSQVDVDNATSYADQGTTLFTQVGTCHAATGHMVGRINGYPTQIIVSNMARDLFLFDWNCDAIGLCGNTQLYNWIPAGATCSGTGLGPQYQVAEALPTLGLELPSTEALKLPTMNETATVNPPNELAPAIQAAINLEATHRPSIKRLNAFVDHPTHVISPVYIAYDKDGVIRWHVGVVDLNHGITPHMGVKAGAAMTMSINREFTANGATAPVVVEPGYIMIKGK